MNASIIVDFLFKGLEISAPIAFAALGAAFSEKSGVVNIGLEGFMATTAFTIVWGSFAFHSIWMGLLVQSNDDYVALVNKNGAVLTGTTDRWSVSTQPGEEDLYLQEYPRSAMVGTTFADRNGDPGTPTSGSYCWVVGKNGEVFGAYKHANNNWYNGSNGSYP